MIYERIEFERVPLEESVAQFAQVMQRRLNALRDEMFTAENHQSSWRSSTYEELEEKLLWSFGNLLHAVKNHNRFGIANKAADIANAAMMVADKARGLEQ